MIIVSQMFRLYTCLIIARFIVYNKVIYSKVT